MKIVSYKTRAEIREAREIALENHLYVNGFLLYDWLTFEDRVKDIKKIKIAQIKGSPVGICLETRKKGWFNVSVFVKKKFRRNGIGSRLLNGYKNTGLVAWDGVRGSVSFYKKNGIRVI